MSFFEDDFYSTKTSNRRSSGRGFGSGRSAGRRTAALVICSFAAGMLAALFLLPHFMFSEQEQKIEPKGAVRAASAMPNQENFNDRVVDAAEKVKPAVVSVVTELKPQNDAPQSGDQPSPASLGSGVIFKIDGDAAYVVTNNHVVEDADRVEVILTTGQHKKAHIVGLDKLTDLAVLKVDSSGIKTTAVLGSSDALKAGQTAIAIGNPLGLGFSQTITMGIISSPNRTIAISLGNNGQNDWEMEVIQTDAAINQGNSGGALVNLDGEVIGINSMKVADMGVEGLGFAIPIDQAKPIIRKLMKDGKIKRPYMGIYTQDLLTRPEDRTGLKLPKQVKTGIIVLDSEGPAKEAGLKSEDVIVRLDEHNIGSTLELRKYLYTQKQIGDKVEVTYYRKGEKEHATIELRELKEDK